MAYIPPQEDGLSVKEYAAVRRVSTRTVYGKLAEKAIVGAQKTFGGWRIPKPLSIVESPFVGQSITFSDGSFGEITSIEKDETTVQFTAIVRFIKLQGR